MTIAIGATVTATAAIVARTNFEVFVREVTTPELVWRLCEACRALFATGAVRGRMELRFGSSIQFLDFDIVGRRSRVPEVFALLRRVYGANVVFTLHKGKAQVS